MRENSRAKTRLQALCTLDGLGALTVETVVRALEDRHPGVREHAVRVSEMFLRKGNVPQDLRKALLARVEDSEIRVRYQLAFTLGEWKDPAAGRTLVRLALKDQGEADIRTAVLSSALPHAGVMISEVLARDDPPARLAEELLGLAASTKDEKVIAAALERVVRSESSAYSAWQVSGLAGFLDALERNGLSTGPRFFGHREGVDALVAHARRTALDPGVDAGLRAQAVRLLGRQGGEQEEDLGRLAGLLAPLHPTVVHRAVLTRLRRTGGKRPAAILLEGWTRYGPAVKAEALGALLGREEGIEVLLEAIEKGAVSPRELDLSQRQRLLTHGEQAVRTRASKIFSAVDTDRAKVLAGYRDVPGLDGDRSKGGALFTKHCATCHLHHGKGKNAGPDLSGYASKPLQDLVVAILDPNRVIAGGYLAYTVQTKDGRVLNGIITAETANSFTLRMAGGAEETLLRSDVARFKGSGLSLMPVGFEKAMTPQDLADLIAFIRAPVKGR